MPCDVDQPNVALFEVFGGCVLDRRSEFGVIIKRQSPRVRRY